MSNYEQMAIDFCNKFGVEFRVTDNFGIVDKWNSKMEKWEVQLVRGSKVWTFPFYMGLGHNGAEPTAYDVLASLTKYDVGSLEEFCSEFGYDYLDDETGLINKESIKTYKAVIKEYRNVLDMFSDCIDELSEIA